MMMQQHARDPNKSYAEQLSDFSKTPVGAVSLSGTYLKSGSLVCDLQVLIAT